MNKIVTDIITSSPDAKSLTDSMTARWVFVGAVGWAAQNISAWLQLDQSTTVTVTAGIFGFVTFLGALVGIMRRKGIAVPLWIVAVLESLTKEDTATKLG